MSDTRFPSLAPSRSRLGVGLLVLMLALAGCATGLDFVKPAPAAPDDWTNWRSGDDSLRGASATAPALPSRWWLALGDPVLDRLQERAITGSPDIATALLRYRQARVKATTVAAQRGPDVSVGGNATRQRQSQYGAGTRMVDAIGGDRARLAEVLSEPFTLHLAGFDASWEPDFWGRVRRSVEAAGADLDSQGALLDLARLSVASDIARHYAELRTTQREIQLTREEAAALDERIDILVAREKGGLIDHLDLARQRAEVANLKGQLPALLAREGHSASQIALLLGERPGTLRADLVPLSHAARVGLPDLALGLPSEVALRRPDIRAAEARLHRATARIGVARAELYPSIRIGGHFSLESYLSGEFLDWGSRAWSLGPSIKLPLFDGGRRKSMVALRELEQQEAAVTYQQTVLLAWHEIDEALTAYAAEQQHCAHLTVRVSNAADAYRLATARYEGGRTDFLAVLDSQRSHLQARRDLAAAEGRLIVRYVAINKAIGNVQPLSASYQTRQ